MSKVKKSTTKKVTTNNGWTKHESKNEITPFFKFVNNGDTFTGTYIESKVLKVTKGKGAKAKEEESTINIFLNHEDEKKYALPNNFQIKEAIEEHGKCDYKITLLDKVKIKGGRMLSEFEILTKG